MVIFYSVLFPGELYTIICLCWLLSGLWPLTRTTFALKRCLPQMTRPPCCLERTSFHHGLPAYNLDQLYKDKSLYTSMERGPSCWARSLISRRTWRRSSYSGPSVLCGSGDLQIWKTTDLPTVLPEPYQASVAAHNVGDKQLHPMAAA